MEEMSSLLNTPYRQIAAVAKVMSVFAKLGIYP
jgi:hypothetical protein